MKTSFFIKNQSTIDRLNTYYNRDRNSELNLNYFDEIDEIYLSSRTLFEMRTKENKEGFESPKLGKLYNFEKPISILPQSYSIYSTVDINEIEDVDEINIDLEDISERKQRITKIDYINFFYSEISDEPMEFGFNENTFSRYLKLNQYFIDKMTEIRRRIEKSTLLSFLHQPPPRSISNKKISPYLFFESSPKEYTSNFENFFRLYPNIRQDFDSFLLYINLQDFSEIDTFNSSDYLSNFENILIWIPDFNELYASKEKIKSLKLGLEKLFRINENIVYLYGGILIRSFFSDFIKEIIFRINIYPSFTVLPHSTHQFFPQIKKIFFPYFGRVTTPKNILDAQYRDLFECQCHSCSNCIQEGSLNVNIAIEKIEKSGRMNFYHNLHGFLKKIKNNEPVELDPDLSFNGKLLYKKWCEALNDY